MRSSDSDRDTFSPRNRRRRRRSSTGSHHSPHGSPHGAHNNNNNNNNNNIQRLNIDGFFFDSTAVAAMLKSDGFLSNNDKSSSNHQQQFQGREIIFRNISIDATVLNGARELLWPQNNTDGEKNNQSTANAIASNTDIDIIHCSGLVSELIRIVLPTTRRFGFAGNIPIAHNLDTEGLGIIGETLKRNASSSGSGDKGNHPQDASTLQVPLLKSLVLKGTRLESSGFQHFCDGLRVTTSLEELQLSTCILQEEDVLLLAEALQTNRSLKSIFFANCKFGTKTTTTVANNNHLNHRRNNGRAVESTQSINNSYPQINLPVVLEALVHHPKLESLKLYDMVCNEHAIQAIGKLLEKSTRLQVLGLKNNLSHPKGRLPGISKHLFPALSKNPSVTSLKLSGNNLNDQDMIQLGNILTNSKSSSSIQSLSIADNLISNGLLSLASNLSRAKSLKCLDILRNPLQKESKTAMVQALQTNVQLERLDLDGSWDAQKFWWLSLNRAGRRALVTSSNKSLHSSLWPTILERAYKVPVRRNSSKQACAQTTNVGVVYYLIRRIPWLFEKASTAATATTKTTASTTTTTTTTKTTAIKPPPAIMAMVTPRKSTNDTTTPVLVSESRPDQKRQRERVTKDDDSTETFEPKAKRIFNP